MDPKNSSQSVSGSYKVEPDVDNLNDNFAGLVFKQEESTCPIVFFDLDITRRDSKLNEIFQIAARCNDYTFSECILPENIKEINGFRVAGGTLYHYGNEVNALSPREGLQKFLEFLGKQTVQTGGLLLAAHNCFSIHRHIIVRLMRRYGLIDVFQALVLGFIDTVPVFKAILTERPRVKPLFSLKKLATDYLGENAYPERIHAVERVSILVSLIHNDSIRCTHAMLVSKVKFLYESILFIGLKQAFGEISPRSLKKIALAGISIEHLIEVYSANGAAGVSNRLQGLTTQQKIATINARLAELHGNRNTN